MAPFYAPQNFNSHFEAGAGIQYQLLQSGGMAVDTPHVPHNTPEGEVGKPEGLSGSQIAANSLLCILTLPLLRSIKKCKLCNDSSQQNSLCFLKKWLHGSYMKRVKNQ
jgi:hypothetical protein